MKDPIAIFFLGFSCGILTIKLFSFFQEKTENNKVNPMDMPQDYY